jgi:hypothetical protein
MASLPSWWRGGNLAWAQGPRNGRAKKSEPSAGALGHDLAAGPAKV